MSVGSSSLFSRHADRSIQGTNDDASVSKMSCVSLGYFEDPFLPLFTRRRTRRPPMINRGYFARVQAIKQVVKAFMEETTTTTTTTTDTATTSNNEESEEAKAKAKANAKGKGKPRCGGQIISLGAGWDTTFFRLCRESQSQCSSRACRPRKYIEVDHKEVTSGKCRSIQKNASLMDLIATPSTSTSTCNAKGQTNGTSEPADEEEEEETKQKQKQTTTEAERFPGEVDINVQAGTLLSESYALLPCDLRNVSDLKAALEEKGHVEYGAPTLVILECVIAYLDGSHTRNILRYLADHFTAGCCVVLYDMIGPEDPFGQQLIYNVESRGCPLPGIRSFPSKASHIQVLQEAGFTSGVGVHTMLEVYREYVDAKERGRIERIEFLDELEEWNLIMSHYCLSYAFKGDAKVFGTLKMPLQLSRSSLSSSVHRDRDMQGPVPVDRYKYMD